MRRKSDADIYREHRSVIIVGVLFILAGLFIIFVPIIDPPAPLDELIEKQVTVADLRHIHQVKGSDYDLLTTTEGEKFNLTGDYRRDEVYDALTEGKAITIYYQKSKLFFRKYAEIVIADEQELVRFDNDEPQGEVGRIIFGCVTVLLGVAFMVGFRWELRHNRRMQAKRDARIRKKYGAKTEQGGKEA